MKKHANEEKPYKWEPLPAPDNQPSSFGRMPNKDKIEVLDKYSLVYGEENLYQYNILPILLSKPYLLAKIETFYDRQFEELLKKKSLQALDFPRMVHEAMKSKFRESRNYFVQSLSNIIYSSDKYAEDNEISLFLEFCQKKGENLKLMFYIFIRQHFKILSYTTFLSHYKTASDPSKIAIMFENGLDILTVALSHEKTASSKFLEEYKKKYQKTSKIYYYEFMMTVMKVRFVYGDLPMLEKALALYRVTNFSELTNVFTNKQGTNEIILSPQKNIIRIEEDGRQQIINQITKSINVNATNPQAQMTESFGPRGDNNNASLILDKSMEVGKARQEYILRISSVNREYYGVVKNEIKPFSDGLIAGYIEKSGLDPNELSMISANISLQIQKKLFYLVNAIFGEDRKRFFYLIRIELGTNNTVLDFWMDLQDSVKETQRLNLVNSKIASDFLMKLFNFPVINAQIMFLMSFRLQPNDDLFDIELNIN